MCECRIKLWESFHSWLQGVFSINKGSENTQFCTDFKCVTKKPDTKRYFSNTVNAQERKWKDGTLHDSLQYKLCRANWMVIKIKIFKDCKVSIVFSLHVLVLYTQTHSITISQARTV